MTDSEAFRQRILERQRELLGEAGIPDPDTVELDQTRVGRVSRMDALQQQQMDLALRRRQEGELAALDNALRRIEDGVYGECLECGGAINPKRLEIDPAATHCIDCASALEH